MAEIRVNSAGERIQIYGILNTYREREKQLSRLIFVNKIFRRGKNSLGFLLNSYSNTVT